MRYILWGCLLVAELFLLHQCSYFLPPLRNAKIRYLYFEVLEYCKMLSLAVFSDIVGLKVFKTAIWFTSSCCTILLGPPRRGLLHMVPSVTYRFIHFHTVKNARKGKMDNVFKWNESFSLTFQSKRCNHFMIEKMLLFFGPMSFVYKKKITYL